jgi:predicted transcriptional regulator
MTDISSLKKRWMRDPAFKEEYAALEEEFAGARELIMARSRARLSQAEVARRMGTTQSAIARLEAGGRLPSLRTLERYARATNSRPEFRLRPS